MAGKRSSFENLPRFIGALEVGSRDSVEFSEIEDFSPYSAIEKIRSMDSYEGVYFEVGLHLIPGFPEGDVSRPFVDYAKSLGFEVYERYSFRAGTLLFFAVRGSKDQVETLAQFTLLRVVRPIPKLRSYPPSIVRNSTISIPFSIPLEQPISSEPRVAILDGGLPSSHILTPWVRRTFLSDETANDVESFTDHGLAVTSAFLFGPIIPNSKAERPFSYVNHHRVLDHLSAMEPPLELYRTLEHIEEILLSRQYDFINLSLGPDLPIEDTDVHAWTSVIDELLSDGDIFMTIAAGNNGQNDIASGNARIQVPSDCVNGITVGAADRRGLVWERAPYSAIGPGRSPGRRKPDIVAFGGSSNEYFHVASASASPSALPTLGTSFAAPYVLRSAVGIRAILGNAVHPLTVKALLIHGTCPHAMIGPDEIGWGKVAEDINEIIICPDGMARVIYQGELKAGKYLRAPLPLPKYQIQGKVRLTATFCYASPVDPQDASAYTRAGLGITFRPHSKKYNKDSKKKNPEPTSRSFFPQSEFKTEAELRGDLGKWETVLHASDSLLGKSLHEASFDIHYNARDGGMNAKGAPTIRYALVLTIEAPKHPNIYEEILENNDVLISLQPQVSVPIRA